MASAASASGPKSSQYSRLSSRAALESWWLGTPRKLRRYSTFLSAAWSDGIYLTAWPRLAVTVPIAVLLLGFLEGTTHWSPLTIDGSHLSTSATALAFMQIFPLLLFAALAGSISGSLGLMLVVGFAIGEYLIAGPFLTLGNWTPISGISGFLELRVPLLYSYAIFLGLAVVPSVFGSALLRPLARKFPRDNLVWITVRVVASAILQAALVYGWIMLAPMTLRLLWTWAKQTPPLNPTDYSSVLNPWLPLAAAIGVIIRALLARRAAADPLLKEHTLRLWQEARQSDQNPAWTRRSPAWLRAVGTALACTLLLAGLVASWWLAAAVFVALAGICLMRNCVLPGLGWWMKWSRIIHRVPPIFRLAVAIAAGYLITLELLQLPGWGVRENGNPGHFEAELACFGVGLLIMVALLPYVRTVAAGSGKQASSKVPSAALGAAARILLFCAVLGTSMKAWAICLDPACCFGNNNDAAMTEGILFMAAGFLFLSGAGFLLAAGLEMGAAAAATDMALGDTILADTILADTLPML